MALKGDKERLFYHATPMENFQSVYACGITRSLDGYVHLTKDARTAVRYASSNGERRIACFTVEIDDFGCKVFGCESLGYRLDIKPEQIRDLSLWDLTKQLI